MGSHRSMCTTSHLQQPAAIQQVHQPSPRKTLAMQRDLTQSRTLERAESMASGLFNIEAVAGGQHVWRQAHLGAAAGV